MKIVNLVQGTAEWHKFRNQHHTASQAPIMMGASRHMSRDGLLKMKAVGNFDEESAFVQELYERGHEAEKAARVIVEQIVGCEFYPATAVGDDERFSASFDGITFDEETLFEHKLYNKELIAQINVFDLHPEYFWQLEHQLFLSGAKCVYFVCSDGTKENWASLVYVSKPERRAALLAAWEQFDKDLKAYIYQEPPVTPTANTIVALPALSVELVGQVTKSNLDLYQTRAIAFIKSIKTDLQTDQDFVDADATVKFCEKAEKELDLVKKQALSQTETISILFTIIDGLKEQLRTKRLALDKLVKSRKDAIKSLAVQNAKRELAAHIEAVNAALQPVCLPEIEADFVEVIKGKKTIKSMGEAINDEMARVKIEVNAQREKIAKNLAAFDDVARDHKFLFADLQDIIGKDGGDFVLYVQNRISTHETEQRKKREAELAAQQQAKVEAPVAPKAAADNVVPLVPVSAPIAEAPKHKVQILGEALYEWAQNSEADSWRNRFIEIADTLLCLFPEIDVAKLQHQKIARES